MAHLSCTLFIVTLILSASWAKSHYDTYDLADVTLFLIKEHLKDATSTIALAEHSSSPEFVNENINILNHILQNLGETIAVQINNVESTWDYYIFIIDSFSAFKFLLSKISISFKDSLLHFIIILTNYDSEWQNTIDSIFINCYKINVMNVNIIAKQSNGSINMYTYLLFVEHRCRVVTTVVYFSFNRDWRDLQIVFPEKLKNFYKCPLKVSARNERPFVNFDGNTSNPEPIGNWNNLRGIEGKLLKYLSENLNFSIELLPFVDETSYKNGEIVYGSYLKLVNHEADVAIGSFSASDPFRKLVSQSHIYFRSPIKHIVRGKVLSMLSRLGLPLNLDLWLLLVAFFFSQSIFILSLRFVKPSIRNFILGKNNKTAIFNLVAFLVGSPITAVHQRNFARFLMMMLLLLDLVLRTVYLGSLYEVIRVKRTFTKPPSNFDELINKNYVFLLPPDIIHLNLHPKNQIIMVAGNFEKRLQELAKSNGKYATLVLHPNFITFSQDSQKLHKENELLMMDDVFMMYQIAMAFTKRSIYLDVFNKKIVEFSCCGILAKLLKELNQAAYRFNTVFKPKQVTLTIKHLEAFFHVWFYLNLLAVGVFGLEVLSERYQRVKNVLDWINN